MSFAGFPRETLTFLEGIAAANSKEWFTANRPLWDATVAAARAFVDEVGPSLRVISPGVNFDSKIGGSLPRANRDTRVAHDKPYRNTFDLWFWHGDKKGWEQPGFFLRITAQGVWIASGMMHILYPVLPRYRDAVVAEASGERLASVVAAIDALGRYEVGYPSRKSVPKGYDKDHARAAYLLQESLWGHLALPAEAVLDPNFADVAVAAWRDLWPLSRWLLEDVTAR